jgi:hypothetical protein
MKKTKNSKMEVVAVMTKPFLRKQKKEKKQLRARTDRIRQMRGK